jgi:SAM-dependent methyltransferase/glycosyltransferase involved in cell wall biosynthesis
MPSAIPSEPQRRPSPLALLRAEMRAMPPLDLKRVPEASIGISLLIPARGAESSLEETVRQAHAFLSREFAGDFEIVLIPNPSPHPKPGAAPDRTIEISERLASRHPEVRVTAHRLPQGKGAALRTGFAMSRGRMVCFTDADLPYRLDFFAEARAALASGFDLVTGNRRLGESVFDMPVGLLKLAYRRHKLGLLFNRAARLLMPLTTTDTQAGIKAMSRELALEAFGRQRCPGFFFDLELFLTARAQGMRHAELPVLLYLNSEKSTVRILREAWLASFWLLRISLRNRFGSAYGDPRRAPLLEDSMDQVPSRYPRTGLATQAFLQARWRLTPYTAMASKLPPRGRILDLGCGHGLFSLALALGSPDREIIGLDHDVARIELAEKAAAGLPNVRFARGTLSDPEHAGRSAEPASAQGISMIDVMHYFPAQEQERLFKQAFELLAPGGTLIVREVDPEGKGLASSFNRFYEKMATATGFTRSEQKETLHFRSREDWEETLRRAGFDVTSERCSHPLFADILYVCRKPAARASTLRSSARGHA